MGLWRSRNKAIAASGALIGTRPKMTGPSHTKFGGTPMPAILGGLAILAIAAIAANATGNPDTVGWVILAAPFGLFIGLWLLSSICRSISARSRK